MEDDEKSEDEFYTLEEMDGIKNKSYTIILEKF